MCLESCFPLLFDSGFHDRLLFAQKRKVETPCRSEISGKKATKEGNKSKKCGESKKCSESKKCGESKKRGKSKKCSESKKHGESVGAKTPHRNLEAALRRLRAGREREAREEVGGIAAQFRAERKETLIQAKGAVR